MERKGKDGYERFFLFHIGRTALGCVRYPYNAKTRAIRIQRLVIDFQIP